MVVNLNHQHIQCRVRFFRPKLVLRKCDTVEINGLTGRIPNRQILRIEIRAAIANDPPNLVSDIVGYPPETDLLTLSI